MNAAFIRNTFFLINYVYWNTEYHNVAQKLRGDIVANSLLYMQIIHYLLSYK